MALNFNDDGIFRPEAEAIYESRVVGGFADAPYVRCLPRGPGEIVSGDPYRIVQSPTVIGLLLESGPYRQIFTDGRELPVDPNPTWMGYSIGHWDGDTLVVETTGFKEGWLDDVGHPRSEKLRVTEKFRRVDFGHMQFEITFDDPLTLIKPLNLPLAVNYAPDTSMIETVCNEDERDRTQMTSTVVQKVEVSPATLAKYTGTYEFAGDNPGLTGRTLTVTVSNGRLHLNSLPLVPRSDTEFFSAVASAQFSTDPNGVVSHLMFFWDRTAADSIASAEAEQRKRHMQTLAFRVRHGLWTRNGDKLVIDPARQGCGR